MLSITDYLLITLFGSIGAFLSGFLGVGGGIIYIPLLDYFLSKMGMQNEMLVKGILANSLFAIIFSGSVSSYNQFKVGNFYPKQIINTAVPGMLSALILTYLIKTGTWYNKTMFNYVFAIMLFVIVVKMFSSKSKENKNQQESKNLYYNITGFFAGLVTAFTGLGGGVVMTPVFTDILKLNIKKASSISNGVIPLFAIIVGVYNLSTLPAFKVSEYQIGYIVLPVVLPLIIATFVFAPMGVKIAQKAGQQSIRITFATLTSIIFIKLLYEIFIQ